jgi:type I restriction enzyme S subunit
MSDNSRTLPQDWTEHRIEELFAPLEDCRTLHQGWSPQCEREPSPSEDVWGVLKTTSIQAGEFQPEHNKRLPNKLKPRPLIEVRPGDILITCAGPRVRCGVSCLVRQTRKRLMMSGKMYRFRIDEKRADSRYIEAFLQTEEARLAIEKMKTGSSDSGLNLTHDRFRQLTIPVAPLDEQQRIVEEFEKQFTRLETGVAALQSIQAKLKRYRAAILKAACEGNLVAIGVELANENDRSRGTSQQELESIRERMSNAKVRRGVPDNVPLSRMAERIRVPEGWTLKSVADLLRAGALIDVKDGNHGTNHPRSAEFTVQGLPFITATEVNNFRIDYERAAKVSGAPLAKLKVGFAHPGDVILTHKGSVGRVAISDKSCVLSPQTTYYRFDDQSFNRRYLQYFFASPQFQSQLDDVKSQTTRDFVPISDQYWLFILRPPLAEQTRIAAEIERRLSVVEELEAVVLANVHRATRLRESILQRAFAGELIPPSQRNSARAKNSLE